MKRLLLLAATASLFALQASAQASRSPSQNEWPTYGHDKGAMRHSPLAEGAERALETLVRADLPDEAWLRSIAAFGEINARATSLGEPLSPGIDALILFLPGKNFSLGQTDR